MNVFDAADGPANCTDPSPFDGWFRHFNGIAYRCAAQSPWNLLFAQGSPGGFPFLPEQKSRADLELLIHSDDRARVQAEFRNACANRGRLDLEYRLTIPAGDIRWVWEQAQWNGEAGGILDGLILDITDRKRAEQDLLVSVRRYRRFFENAAEGLFRSDADGRFLDINLSLARMLGYDTVAEALAVGDPGNLYADPPRRREFLDLLRAEGGVRGFESEALRKNGERIWISENAQAVFDSRGEMQFVEGSVTDISERKHQEETDEYRATHDVLTGLPNRAMLAKRLEQGIRYARQHQQVLAAAFIDFDQLSVINESMGHAASNDFIKVMAVRLKACVRECDTVAREGREQFVVLLTEQPSREAVDQAMQRIRQQILRPWEHGEREFHVSCSIGVSLFPEDGITPESLLKSAGSAMANARESGGNTLRFFTSEFGAQLRDRFEREQNLRAALIRKDFVLHYQPRIDLASGELTGAEVLVRGSRPGSALLPPAEFIPLAEETGLISALGSWILETACRQVRHWTEMGYRGLTFAVNISPRQFEEGDFCGEVRKTLRETGVDPGILELELTENLVMHDAESFISVLTELKELGIKLAIDDFGAGYSNLSYLRRFPVDRLKIDQSFIRDVDRNVDDAAIVSAIVNLGHSLSLCVVAEGAERPEQFEFIRRIGCDEGQGDLFGRAMSQEEFEALLSSRAAAMEKGSPPGGLPWLTFFGEQR